jgi:SagB-type dehydrogenase family enzyme
VAHWKDGELLLNNYATRVSISASPIAVTILHFFNRWRRPDDLIALLPGYTPASVRRAARQLAASTMLVREGSPEARRDDKIAADWGAWLPDGGFHFATKNAPYVDPRWDARKRKSLLPTTPQPRFFKRYPRAPKVALPPLRPPSGEFLDVLHARKTHRTFSRRPVSVDQVSQLLGRVWGVQGWLETQEFGALAHKTSPSGGARHPGEVYVLAQRVDGLEPGLYHYDSIGHRLETISTGPVRSKAWRYCERQSHAREAAALFLMTAVFARTMWKYHHARAYRVVMLDAGHLCQTFCLVATWLGLGPFCTAALDDERIEKDLGIDGVNESVLYVAGVGRPGLPPAASRGAAAGRRRP